MADGSTALRGREAPDGAIPSSYNLVLTDPRGEGCNASLGQPFQDGPTLLFLAYYPLEPGAPPAALHEWGLAAYDPDHGLQLVMTNIPENLFLVGRCMSV